MGLPSLADGQSGQGTVTGLLLDGETGAPLEFATISVYAAADSSLVDGGLTEAGGRFELSLDPGRYYAVIQFVGFQNKTTPAFTIQSGEEALELGQITLNADAVALEEVEVVAERSRMQLKLDKRVFNVGKDLTTSGGTAADILDNVPSITVDVEGNVSLRGSQNVRILIDGKPSGLVGMGDVETLRRMQGDIIESIEVITNPSARYEAEGEAGIINIILKKDKKKGVNGSFGLTTGWPHNHGASYSLNFRRDDLNFFSNFGLNYGRAPGGGSSSQRFFEDGVLDEFYTTDRDQIRGGLGGNLQLGADWFADEYNTLTGSVLYRYGMDDNLSTVTYRDFDGNNNLINETVRDTEEKEEEHNIETALSYRRTFDEPGREWTFDFKYISDRDTELADYEQVSDSTETPLLQRSSNTEDEINWLFQTDYIQPVGENGKLEGGLRAALRTVNNDFLVEEEADGGEYFPLSEFDDRLKYTENVYAAYIMGGTEFGAVGFQAGLRAEYSDVTAALLKSDVKNEQHYLSLFPSAALTYKFNAGNQLQLSYSRRLSRPYFRRLLPFSNYGDPRNNSVGNPNLRPEFTNSFELGFLKFLPKGSFLTGLYYRHTTGVIDRVTLPADDGTTIRFPINLASQDAYGLELNFSYDFTDWWQANADVNFFRAISEGTYEGVVYANDTYAWNGRADTKVTAWKMVDIQASFNYRAPQRTTQGRRLAIYSFDLGLSTEVLQGKGSLTLNGRDLFNTRKWRNEIDLPEFKSESVFQWRQTRRVVLTFSYRLNQEKRRRGGGDRDDFGGDF